MIYQGPIEPPQWYVLQGILHPINDLAFQNGLKFQPCKSITTIYESSPIIEKTDGQMPTK